MRSIEISLMTCREEAFFFKVWGIVEDRTKVKKGYF